MSFFCCLSCKGDLHPEVFAAGGSPEEVKEGVFFCQSCKTFYPITEGIPFLLDSGYYEYFDIQDFIKRWNNKFDFKSYTLLDRKTVPEKMKQITFYHKDSEVYDDLVVDSTFWKAHGSNVINEWIAVTPLNGLILDIGCGTGRCSEQLAQSGRHVIATDISFAMLRKAAERKKNAGLNSITYFLADAEDLPLKPGLFSTVTAYGMLHHASAPGAVIREVGRILKSGGIFCILENHDSPMRPLFDILMKVWKLWNEEAGSHPLFKITEIKKLIINNGMKEEIRTSVFLPPHVFNFMSFAFARKILFLTDWLLGNIPLIKNMGGQLIVKATKV